MDRDAGCRASPAKRVTGLPCAAENEAQREAVEARVRRLAAQKGDLMDVRITVRSSNHHVHGEHEVRLTVDPRCEEIGAGRPGTEAGLARRRVVDVFPREVRRRRVGAAAAGSPARPAGR